MDTARLKQPAGLPVLFFAEMWERFGFYCVQALLVLFLTQKLAWSDKSAYDLFSAFSALIYATPVIGGYLADKVLGFRWAILMGAVLYLLGYFGLSTLNPKIFDFALAALICGNGFFKANVSSLLGTLYDENDPRRESGFTLFYMGINIGSFLAPIVCTFIAVNYGWHYGFMSAGIGMIFCLAICIFGFKQLDGKGLPPMRARVPVTTLIYVLIAVALLGIAKLLHHSQLTTDVLLMIGAGGFLGLLAASFFESKQQRLKLFALIILMIFSILFWALYVQMFSSVTLFTQRVVNREIFGVTIPAGMFASSEAFFIIVLSPLFAMLWLKLNRQRSRLNPSTAMKFALALIFVGSGFLFLVLGIKLAGPTGLVAMGWLILNYFLLTIGELSLSPIGLSAVTSLAPPKLVGMVMGIWFLSLSAAYAIGGKIADLTAMPTAIANNPVLSAPIYQQNFLHFGLASVAVGILLMLLVPVLKRMMQE